jgi:hypothetical protein
MTTIAYKDGVLAGDKRACYGQVAHPVTKVRRLKDGSIAGGAGTMACILQMLDWLDSGGDHARFPAEQRTDDWEPILVVRPDRRIQIYERTPFPTETHSPFFAIGSGKEYAMMAMHLGKSAAEAVALAAQFDPGTGHGVDTLFLDQDVKLRTLGPAHPHPFNEDRKKRPIDFDWQNEVRRHPAKLVCPCIGCGRDSGHDGPCNTLY